MKLNIGCGYDKKSRFLGIDVIRSSAVDVRADINYLPFKKNIFDEIYLSHVLEHVLDPIKALKEVHKISKPNCKITIGVPHAFTHSSFLNPTHRIHFLIGSILYWTKFTEFGADFIQIGKNKIKNWKKNLEYFVEFCAQLMGTSCNPNLVIKS